MADIFLSYSREDEARAKNLVVEFEARGWSVFWDRRIPAGQTWRTHIGSALQDARCVVVTWSKHSIESQWVAEEADEGKARGVLVPILLDPVQPPRGFREIQAADLCNWQAGQASDRLAELLGDLQRMLGRQQVPTPENKPAEERIAPKPVPVERVPDRSRKGALVIAGAILGVVVLAFVVVRHFLTLSATTERQRAAIQDAMEEAEARREEAHQEILDQGKALAEDIQSSQPQTESSPPTQQESNSESDAVVQRGSWLIIAGSFRPHERERALQVRDALVRAGLQADVVESNDYPLLTPGLLITRVGPFEQKGDANHALFEVRRIVIDAYVKKGR